MEFQFCYKSWRLTSNVQLEFGGCTSMWIIDQTFIISRVSWMDLSDFQHSLFNVDELVFLLCCHDSVSLKSRLKFVKIEIRVKFQTHIFGPSNGGLWSATSIFTLKLQSLLATGNVNVSIVYNWFVLSDFYIGWRTVHMQYDIFKDLLGQHSTLVHLIVIDTNTMNNQRFVVCINLDSWIFHNLLISLEQQNRSIVPHNYISSIQIFHIAAQLHFVAWIRCSYVRCLL